MNYQRVLEKVANDHNNDRKICDGFDIMITDFFNNETFGNLEQEIK